MRTLRYVCSGLVLTIGLVGCSGPEGGPASAPSGAGAKVLQVNAQRLPKLGATLSPVDEGRLEIAPPAGWHVPPRSRRWLVRFQADPGSPYPMIFVTVEDSDALFHVTRENLEEFTAGVRGELLADSDTRRLAAGLQPVVIGSFHGTLYRRWGRSDGRVMERWMLETVANGRRYTLELRSREGLADEYLPHLYAVASGLKFVAGKDTGSVLTIVEEAPEVEPADDVPPEKEDEDEEEGSEVESP